MQGLCTGAGWQDAGLAVELRDGEGKRQLRIGAGDPLAFAIAGARRCIGYRPPGAGALIACPQERRGIAAAQCASCFSGAQILACLRCTGERCANPARRRSCVAPENHAVYLASFGPGAVKVGVARWTRRRERLAEQGARVALIVGRDDGQQVRRVESQYRTFINGVQDRFSPAEKLAAYTAAESPQRLLDELYEVLAMSRPRVSAEWLDEPEVVDLPVLPVLSASPRMLRPGAELRVRGTVAHVLGQTLIVDCDTGERVALEAPSLAGYELRALDAREHGEAQLSLALD